ncbi:uncharacterized protein LOC127860667 isoform X2 [Dreissena polymorpha]|uniref:uncharacterized protein LOC127860667 isoform X2 n=1 Tax=Dreissena polymorpha TaxID=45954 RepID=UPI002263B24B|nr:uncharacterized protein LOC127860667 isoform X2 [Dreissena polymorpha]
MGKGLSTCSYKIDHGYSTSSRRIEHAENIELQRFSRHHKSRDVEHLQARLIEYEEEISKLKEKEQQYTLQRKQFQNEISRLKQKSDDWYAACAEEMERSGCMENTNDVHNNSQLADRFDGKVKNLWLDLCDLISHDHPNFSELDRLKILSCITKFVYQQCSRKAEEAVQSLTFGNVDTVTKKELNILLAVRKRAGQVERTRDSIVQKRQPWSLRVAGKQYSN